MKKPILLCDVMNSKSTYHCRHSENAFNISSISKFYARESRLYNSIFDKEKGKYIKGPLWFTNLMVFDFDFDEKHFPNINDYENTLNYSLNKLRNLIGKEKFIIRNKNSYTEEQIERYFTKYDNNGNKNINLPKQYGCQVVYELKDSVQSQYVEIVKLYNEVRMFITKETNGDLNFKGHMFKNFYNKDIFNVEENDDYTLIDIKELALKYLNYDAEKINKIYNLKPFEKLEKTLPNYFKLYNSKLFNFYHNLNTWQLSNNNSDNNINLSDKINKNVNFIYTDSRNETLFNYLRLLPMDLLSKIDYFSVINTNLFEDCTIHDNISELEFNSTLESVKYYKQMHGDDSNIYYDINSDYRVFKFKQEDINLDFFNLNKSQLVNTIKFSRVNSYFNYNNIKIDFYENNSDENILANIFIGMNPEFILSNIRSLFTPDFVSFINETVFNSKYGLYDLYDLFKNAIYLTHFRLYYSLKNKIEIKSNIKELNTIEKRNKLLKDWGFNFKGNISLFKRFYLKLKNNNLLKDDGNAKPISFYQNYFHIRNAEASKLVSLIKAYIKFVKIKANIKNLIDIKYKNSINNYIKTYNKNTSHIKINIINKFNIYNCKVFNDWYNLFNIKEININYLINIKLQLLKTDYYKNSNFINNYLYKVINFY